MNPSMIHYIQGNKQRLKNLISCAILISISLQLTAQEQKSELRLAEEAYARQEYALAGSLFNRVVKSKRDRTPLPLVMKLANCYRETGNFREAAGWYAQVVQRTDCPASAFFAYGDVLRNLELYDSARIQYDRFNTAQPDSLTLKTAALQGCDSAIYWKQHEVKLSNLGGLKELNTPYSEWISGVVKQGLLLVSNGYRKMMLNDGAEANPVTDKRTFQPYYKAYIYQQYAQGNSTMYLEEMLPQRLGKLHYHVGPACFSNAEDTLYVTVNEQVKPEIKQKKGYVQGSRRLVLYYTVKKDNVWSPLEILPALNVDGFSTSHPVLSSNGDVLYFVSDRPGGAGMTDIWYSEKQPDSTWGKPVNCGSRINTVAAETFPTINEDGALFFSSKGHPGMGGYDIFRATGSKDTWDVPMNLQLPFNSGGDDMGFILKRNGYEGYFSSNRPGGQGSDDVYHFMDPAYFTDGRNNNNNTPGNETTKPDLTGGGKKPVKPGISSPGGKKTLTPEELELITKLEKLRFLYDFNSVVLLPESRKVLDYVASVLKQHPEWKLMVLSYTDSRGKDDYNMDLSAMRCFAVIDYLAGKGIDAKRMYYLNRGEQFLVNPCKDGVPCTEEQQRENRRSELKIIY